MALKQEQKMKSGGSAGSGPAAPDLQRTRNILQETIVELKKTTWPTKQEATRLTMVVLGVIFAMSIYMGVLDFVLSFIVHKFSLIK
jgi:preprotein translocase subunit SecE